MLTVHKDYVIYVRGNLLGDEFHYLLECTYFTEERKKYLPKFYLRHVNTLKFQKLMSTENMKLLNNLVSLYLYECSVSFSP